MASSSEFVQRVLDRVAQLAVQKVRPLIPSQTLANALAVIDGPDDSTKILEIPHYWAEYVHDGRGPFGPRASKFLVWFRNPKDDPRTGFGSLFPVRASEIVRLTKEQFREGLARNAEARAAGLPVHMIVAKFQPRVVIGVPFFSDGLDRFSAEIAPAVLEEFNAVLSEISMISDKDTARCSL